MPAGLAVFLRSQDSGTSTSVERQTCNSNYFGLTETGAGEADEKKQSTGLRIQKSGILE